MALFSKTNLYPGINIHLNSYLQSESGDWVSYHSNHIVHIREYLDRNLPDNYYALSEYGLQIGGFDTDTGWEMRSKIRPDVIVTQERHQPSSPQLSSSRIAKPTGTINLAETLPDPEILIGVVIYEISTKDSKDIPIARIELMSPANKIGGSYHKEYSHKRRDTIEGGLQLIEIDYFHAYRPVINHLQSYADKEDDAYPYVVLISDPRPSLQDAETEFYAWDVDAPLPVFPIFLAGDDSVIVDLGEVYNHTYETTRYFHRRFDYSQEPVNFETYTETDQEKIRAMLVNIREKLESE